MTIRMWFGKYRGASLEEIALGKKARGGKAEGYRYFHMLGAGERKYFSYFQDDIRAMGRWRDIKKKLNSFKSIYPCAVCENDSPTKVSIVGNSEYGYSMSHLYICCDRLDCKSSIVAQTERTMIYPLGFDTILNFGWGSGNTKSDELQVTRFMLELAGWKKGARLSAQSASDFIDNLVLR